MKNKKISFFYGISFLFSLWFMCFGVSLGQTVNGNSGTTPTSTLATEFLPDIQDDTAVLEQRKARLLIIQQALKGLISDQDLYSITGQPITLIPSNKTTTNVVKTTNEIKVFTKNLRIGDTDPEVLLLQKALNEDMDTTVATSGVGSRGNETNYFGNKTKLAVITLQNKHAGEVLIPNGLSVGTGYFGASTRAMMNALQKNKTKTQVPGESIFQTIPSGAVSGLGEKVKIDSLYPTKGKNNTKVTINGTGFTASANKIVAGGNTFYNVKSTDGKTLTFTMTASGSFGKNSKMTEASTTYILEHFNEYKMAGFPELKYPVCVTNDIGISNCAFFTVEF